MNIIEAASNFAGRVEVVGKVISHATKHPETLRVFDKKAPIGASIDISGNCNLRCQHCYLYGKDYQEEGVADDHEFLDKVRRFRQEYPTIMHCTWVGGEPMWRRELLREAVKLFPFNWVVTNGTVAIDGEWENTSFWISIDGTREAHNQIRQTWKKAPEGYSVYDRAKKHANTATAPVFVHTVINRVNRDTIPQLVDEWRRETKVRGFRFSLHTPIVDQSRSSGMKEGDEALFLPPQERVEVVAMLLALKDRYGDFIRMSRAELELLLPEHQLKAFGSNCPLPETVVSLDSTLENRKLPCVMGEGMDCNKCGCTIPVMVHRGTALDLQTLALTFGTLTP